MLQVLCSFRFKKVLDVPCRLKTPKSSAISKRAPNVTRLIKNQTKASRLFSDQAVVQEAQIHTVPLIHKIPNINKQVGIEDNVDKSPFESQLDKLEAILRPFQNKRYLYTFPHQLRAAANSFQSLLTPEFIESCHTNYEDNPRIAQLLEGMCEVFFRLEKPEKVDQLVSECIPLKSIRKFYQVIWINHIQKESYHTDSLKEVRLRNALTDQEHDVLPSYTLHGQIESIHMIAQSMSNAILNHNVYIGNHLLSAIILLTLRLIPADLDQVKMTAALKNMSAEQMENLKKMADSSKPENIDELFPDPEMFQPSRDLRETYQYDLLPPQESEPLPNIITIEPQIPVYKRPIPIEETHHVVMEAIGPIWKLLKTSSKQLETLDLYHLIMGFNKATLTPPTIHLIPFVAKQKPTKLRTQCFQLAMQTLCDDIQFEKCYLVYKKYFIDKEGKFLDFVTPEIVDLCLKGVSKSANASLDEKRYIFSVCIENRQLSSEALRNYCFAMSRNAEVQAKELFDILEQSRSFKFLKSELAFYNEIIRGLFIRASFKYAHAAVMQLWENRGPISRQLLFKFIGKATEYDLLDVIDDLLALLNPPNAVKSTNGDHARQPSSTTKDFPIHYILDKESYESIMDMYYRAGDAMGIVKTFLRYLEVDMHPLATAFVMSTMQLCARLGSEEAMHTIFNAALKHGYTPRIDDYNVLIWGLISNGQIDEAMKLYNELPKFGCEPNQITYVNLINGYGKQEMYKEALGVLDMMRNAGIRATAQTYEALIAVFTPTSFERAEWILQNMLNEGIHPTLAIFFPLIKSYADKRNRDMFQLHLDSMIDQFGILPDVKFCTMLVSSLSKLDMLEMVENWLLPLMYKYRIPRLVIFEISLILAYAEHRDDEMVHQLIMKIPKDFPGLPIKLFLPLVHTLAADSLERAWDLVAKMETVYGVAPGSRIYQSLMRETKQSGDVNLLRRARSLLKNNLAVADVEMMQDGEM